MDQQQQKVKRDLGRHDKYLSLPNKLTALPACRLCVFVHSVLDALEPDAHRMSRTGLTEAWLGERLARAPAAFFRHRVRNK